MIRLVDSKLLALNSCFYFSCNFLSVSFQRGDAPSPFRDGPTPLEQAFGLYEAAFCATTQPLPDSVGAALPPADGPLNVFEKQDSTTQMDCAASSPLPPPPPSKRPRRSPHAPPGLGGPQHRPPIKGFPPETPHGDVRSEQTLESGAQRGESSSSSSSSSSGERRILPQHHSSALCVC